MCCIRSQFTASLLVFVFLLVMGCLSSFMEKNVFCHLTDNTFLLLLAEVCKLAITSYQSEGTKIFFFLAGCSIARLFKSGCSSLGSLVNKNVQKQESFVPVSYTHLATSPFHAWALQNP